MNNKIKSRERILTVLLLCSAVILTAVCVIVYILSDRKAPVITVNKEYLENCDLNNQEDVLEAVSAIDDVSETVELILGDIIDFGDGLFKIYFIARDDSGNTSTMSVVVENDTVYEKNVIIEDESAFESGTGQESSDVTEASEESSAEALEVTETYPPGSPVIKLKTNETEFVLGSEFRYLSYIESIVDDIDDENSLFKRIVVEGNYNFTNTGRYKLSYYVTDSDGNKSNTENLIVVVKAG